MLSKGLGTKGLDYYSKKLHYWAALNSTILVLSAWHPLRQNNELRWDHNILPVTSSRKDSDRRTTCRIIYSVPIDRHAKLQVKGLIWILQRRKDKLIWT